MLPARHPWASLEKPPGGCGRQICAHTLACGPGKALALSRPEPLILEVGRRGRGQLSASDPAAGGPQFLMSAFCAESFHACWVPCTTSCPSPGRAQGKSGLFRLPRLSHCGGDHLSLAGVPWTHNRQIVGAVVRRQLYSCPSPYGWGKCSSEPGGERAPTCSLPLRGLCLPRAWLELPSGSHRNSLHYDHSAARASAHGGAGASPRKPEGSSPL